MTERVAGELGVFRSRTAFGSLFWIPLADQRVKERKHRCRHQECVVLVKQIRFIGGPLAQKTDHEFAGVRGAGIGVGVLIGRQILVGPDPGSDERGHRYRRAHGIEEAESHAFQEFGAVLGGAHGNPVEMPFLLAR